MSGLYKKDKKNSTGFTIVELLIVIIIIGILVTLAVTAYNGIQTRSQASRAAAELKQLAKIINLYYQDNLNYPCFDHLWSEAEEREWSAMYSGNWPKNPWGYEYHWEHNQASINYSISVRSPGQDQAQSIDTIADDGD